MAAKKQQEMESVYNALEFEEKIYQDWEKKGYFNPDSFDGEPYSVMMPPPNVTGVLHLGHALENSLMDINVRYQRLNGKKVLLLPGTDHAAVATQAKVERLLMENEGIKNPREQLGREELLKRIRTYSEDSKATILKQIKTMGTSCDWSRLAYTFDEDRSKAVNEVFKKMYEDGLIYRGYRVVNWSVKGQSTCSDDELEHVERQAKFYTFKYSKDFPFTIATTRPETKLGDTAVAVNPKDKRYKKYLGQVFEVDFCGNKLKLKVIASDEVDPEFGTGALGVTPAHSPVDFEMYVQQKAKEDPIEIIPVIDQYGKMTEQAGKDFVGLDVLEARKKVVEKLKEQGLFVKEEDITQSVGTSDRFKDVVEAIPMTQWFIDVNKEIPGRNKSLKQLMKDAVTCGHNNDSKQKVNINPDNFEKLYLQWIDNLRDWCISRQIWWGHRIPVWYKNDEVIVSEKEPVGGGWVQDEDTLDTWFSAGLWTFSTLGWPNQTDDLKTFHPTSWMQMGYELLFFWLARMILMSTYALDQIPFKNVYIHGMLRDEKNQKFSKSAGNNIDPVEVSKKYGTDALRWSLIIGNTPGNDSKFYEEKVEASRNMVNKLWNISRFILTNESRCESANYANNANLSLAEKWILSKFNKLIAEVTKHFDKYEFSQAGELIRDFAWTDFADWFLEVSKIRITDSNTDLRNNKKNILQIILKDLLKLWHPFIPFVTEVIWSQFEESTDLIVSEWPKQNKDLIDDKAEKEFEKIKEVITKIRNLRSEYKVEPVKKITALIKVDNKKFIEENFEIIKTLARLESLEFVKETPADSASAVVDDVEIFLPLADLIDFEKEKERLSKEVENLQKYLVGLDKKLKNEEFVKNAPTQVVEIEKQKQTEALEKLERLKNQLHEIS